MLKMAAHTRSLSHWMLICCVLTTSISALQFRGPSYNSYAIFPPWNACLNASISFEFKTSQEEGLLMYVDDGGRFDYMEVSHRSGAVHLEFNIVDERGEQGEMRIGNQLNNGFWHTVEIIRNRMETKLMVDGDPVSQYSSGSDFFFGNQGKREPVYFGGFPSDFDQRISQLTLQSAFYKTRFEGDIRNVVYTNCSCEKTRARMGSNDGVINYPREACDRNDPCRNQEGCVCISEDSGPTCSCPQVGCVDDGVAHYSIPMNEIHETTVINPSGLDTKAFGDTQVISGVKGNAIKLDGRDTYLKIAGPGHRYECFGDLDNCPNGYTLQFFVNFIDPCNRKFVYMSNGGDDDTNHGVAMSYGLGTLEFQFSRRTGAQWTVRADASANQWYQVTATWDARDGLMLYLDGHLQDSDQQPTMRGRETNNPNDDFIVGRSNDGAQVTDTCVMAIDEFNFWSVKKEPGEIEQTGPMYCYNIPMESARNGLIVDSKMDMRVHGDPDFNKGKLGNAIFLDGVDDYVDGGDQSNTCLGDLSQCEYGITVSMWMKFGRLVENAYFFSTGSRGLEMYYRNGKISVEAQSIRRNWRASWQRPETENWHFIEFTWDADKGLDIYVDLQLVDSEKDYSVRNPSSNSGATLYLGRANTNMRSESYAQVAIDQLDICFGRREKLDELGIITRGRPNVIYVNMDEKKGNNLVHRDLDITLFGEPSIIPGKIEGALYLDGSNQYASLGSHSDSCMGNLDLCENGVLLSVWLLPGKFKERSVFFGTGRNGFRAWYENRKLNLRAETSSRAWAVSTDAMEHDKWQFLELSWHSDRGLEVFVNELRVGSAPNSQSRTGRSLGEQFFLGRWDGYMSGLRNANVTYDDLQYWFGDRSYLTAHGFIQRGRPEYLYFDMDKIVYNRLIHPTMSIPVFGGAINIPGVVNNSVMMNGDRQYIDVGQHYDSCLGNLDHCQHGFTGSMWMNFHRMENDMYYFSTGDSCAIYHQNGNIVVVMFKNGRKWEVVIPDISQHEWHFFEFTWHPDKGLRVYVNNELVGHAETSEHNPSVDSGGNSHVYFGRANGGDQNGRPGYAAFSVDEAEFWYADRDYLIVFNYILRGDVGHMFIPFESRRGNKCRHPELDITLYGGADISDANLIGNSAIMSGNGDYITLGDHERTCMGNLEKCEHGMTMQFYMQPNEFVENGYFISSGPYHIYYKNGRVHFKFSSSTKTWEVSTDRITLDDWQKIDVSWDPVKGLQVYRDDRLIGHTTYYEEHDPLHIEDHTIYIGRPNPSIQNGVSASVKIDEMEYWYANRDYLWSRGYLTNDVDRLIIDMNEIYGNQVSHRERRIVVRGGAVTRPAVDGNGVYLNGNDQYLKVGRQVGICKDNLDYCYKGFHTRFRINPEELKENTYFISSAPLDVFFRNGKLHAIYRTPRKQWRISSSELDLNQWHLVDLSWHPVDGTKMWINGERKDYQMISDINEEEYVTTKPFYIGRDDTEMQREKYPDATIDDFRMYSGRWEYLYYLGILDWDKVKPTVDPTKVDPCRDVPILQPGQKKWLHFDGRSYMTLESYRFPDPYLTESTEEAIFIKFKTSQPDGLLWVVGNMDKVMIHLSLKGGGLHLRADYKEMYRGDALALYPRDGVLNDNKWHGVLVTRQDRTWGSQFHTMKITLDGEEYNRVMHMSEEGSMLQPGSEFFVGGHHDPGGATERFMQQKFEGVMEEISYDSHRVPCHLNLVDMLIRKPIYIEETGVIRITDPILVMTPVTFKDKGAYIRIPPWDVDGGGSIEINFKTTEPNAMILYNGGARYSRQFIAVELFDGIPYFVVDTGQGEQRFRFDLQDKRVDDGNEHSLKVNIDNQDIDLTLDGQTTAHSLVGRNQNLQLGSELYLGAINNPARLPWHMWTRKDKFFLGCIINLKINDGDIDLAQLATDQSVRGVEEVCEERPMLCIDSPCVHGTCYDRRDDFFCDCANTKYTGKRCNTLAPIVTFDGKQYIYIDADPTLDSHTDDISVRFKTHKADGFIFDTSNDRTNDFMKAYLLGGQVVFETNLGGQSRPYKLIFECENHPLNDDEWHTMYIKRRANYVEAWVDNCQRKEVYLPGEGYTLQVDHINIGKGRTDDGTPYVGHLQNFIFGEHKFIEYLHPGTPPDGIDITTNVNTSFIIRPLPIHPITYRSKDNTFVALPTLEVFGELDLQFMFKTREKEGLLFYNDGAGTDFLAIELVNGYLQFLVDDGSGAMTQVAQSGPLDDNKWHAGRILQTSPHSFNMTLDGVTTVFNLRRTTNRLDLTGLLYVGGVREGENLPYFVSARRSFVGCLATIKVNGVLKNLYTDAIEKTEATLSQGCSDTRFCTKDICQHFGVCIEGSTTFLCDCNMTSYVGRHCANESEGYRFGRDGSRGIGIYNINPPTNTDGDKLAFGFMTWLPNGTMVRIDSSNSQDYIEARLEKGYVVVTYDIGDGKRTLVENSRLFNDGQYHYVTFVRNGKDGTLRVDDYDERNFRSTTGNKVGMFNFMSKVKVGGNLDNRGQIIDYFDGILAGVYLNGWRIVDQGINEGRVDYTGDIIVAPHPFFVPRPLRTTPGPVTVPPTVGPLVPVPPGANGGGMSWTGVGPDGKVIPPEVVIPPDVDVEGGESPAFGIVVGVDPGGQGGGFTGGAGGPGGPIIGRVVSGTGGAAGEGARAAAVSGALLGLLMAGSGLMWALYRFKPGLFGGGKGGGGGMSISSPRTGANYHLIKGGFGGTVANGGAGYGTMQANVGTQTTAAMAATADFSEYFSTSSGNNAQLAAGSGIAGIVAGHGTITRGVQSDLIYKGYGTNRKHVSEQITTTTTVYEKDGYGGEGNGSAFVAASQMTPSAPMAYEVQTQTLPMPGSAPFDDTTVTTTIKETMSYVDGRGFSPIPGDMGTMTNNSYQMQNMPWQQQQQQHDQQVSSGIITLAAESIRVDCCQLTKNGQYVITSSLLGPPQIWDTRNGDLIRNVAGEEFSSTDLHLACNDSLLVGQVAELTQIDPNDMDAANRLHQRKLQIWDFNTGQPLDMPSTELCTASCMMADNERIVLGRTDKFGNGTTIVIYDLMGNQALRRLKYDAAIGFADYISYLNLSTDNRYVVAGFQNSYDGKANYIVFDLTLDNNQEPKVLAFDAQVDVTAVLSTHEIVTGTRSGELAIWSMRTGKALRQLVTPPAGAQTLARGGLAAATAAHKREVTALAISADAKFLVSASADGTLKVWDMDTEKLMYTLTGHTDEVWCCALSHDDEFIVSGSRDRTIRLWRLRDGAPICLFNCGMDIFSIKISENKKTIVALGDREKSRKLIMLQIVRTKTRSRAPSRATSPVLNEPYNTYNNRF